MAGKLRRDLKTPKQRYPITKDLTTQELKEYYFVFTENRVSSGADQPLIKKFDENGIPINQTYVDVSDKEYVYFPISIGQLGLAIFHTYLSSKSDQDKERFLKFCEWFADKKNYDYSEKLGARWLTEVPLPAYHNPGPWPSAFSQSRALSILLRGYQLTGDKHYLELAEKALPSFTVSVDQGGITSFTEWGPFYEEYTSEVPTLVLNGLIFALCGVYDFIRVVPEHELANKIFTEGIETLKNILPEYNLGYWSKYNLCEADWYPKVDPATIQYQKLHVTQLKMLYQLTGEEMFQEYAQKFSQQINYLNILRMYAVKFSALRKLGRL